MLFLLFGNCMKEKHIKTGFSGPQGLIEAGQAFATQQGKSWSSVVVDSLEAYLHSHSALPSQQSEAEKLQAKFDQLQRSNPEALRAAVQELYEAELQSA